VGHSDAYLPFLLEPRLYQRVWGGTRLAASGPPIGEAWIVHDDNRILTGPLAARTLRGAVSELGQELLGSRSLPFVDAPAFPLLIKLLDTAEWLSVQVHPDDAWALRLEGPGHRGKTEAWYVLDAPADGELVAGVRPGVTDSQLDLAIRSGGIEPLLKRWEVRRDDSFLIEAGTIHALGPGLFMYEVQQNSDLTYRAYDWDRPTSAGRSLHPEKSAAVSDARRRVVALRAKDEPAEPVQLLLTCPYFTLERVGVRAGELTLETRGESFHALTVINGAMIVRGPGQDLLINQLQTAIVPAAAGKYVLYSERSGDVLISRLP
jgi:mannose-6-phosphate isomerase